MDEGTLLSLRVSAILHNVDQFINYTNHHKHSKYIITQSQSPFLTDRETMFMSLLAYYHSTVTDLPTFEAFESLGFSDGDYNNFLICLAVLRLSVALDHQHRQRLMFVDILEKNDGFELVVETNDPDKVSEELRVFKPASGFFAEVFGKPITLKIMTMSSLH